MNKVKNSLNRSEKAILNKIKHLNYSKIEKEFLLRTNNKLILQRQGIVSINIFRDLYKPNFFDDIKLNKNQVKQIKEYKELFLKVYDILN